jgi:uncharacterized membrane-anchored protein
LYSTDNQLITVNFGFPKNSSIILGKEKHFNIIVENSFIMKIAKTLFLINFLILLLVINYQIYSKENTLAEGALVLLKLAPLDPRSLMQGDYMRLNYAITQDSLGNAWENNKKLPPRGYFVVKLGKNKVAQKVRIQAEASPLNQGELLIKYYRNDWQIRLGAESYFFQEGLAQKFEKAEYGGIRLAKNGESILIGLYDTKFQLIKP